METLNEDVVSEILLRLPTKSIFKFKSVCRTWLRIITEPWFANIYKSSNGLPVLAGFFHVNRNYDLIFNPVNHRVNSPSLNHLPLNLRDLTIATMSSSNGFLLLCTGYGPKMVYNPVTRRRLMIPRMPGNQEWYHAFGLIHEKDDHIKAVFAYKLATGGIQMALHIRRIIREDKIVPRHELPENLLELLVKWECRTKDFELRVYCSKKNEWNSPRLMSSQRHICFEPQHRAGVSIGGNLYWMTLDGSVLVYHSERDEAGLICAPSMASAGLEAKSMHCSTNGTLTYCARDRIAEQVVIWELSDQKTWVLKMMVKLHGVEHLHLEKILYVCHEMQAVFFWTRVKKVYRLGVSEGKLELICPSVWNGVPYLMPQWPAALNGDEALPSSSSSTSSSSSSPLFNCCISR